jgi:hypothetical protein
VGKALDCLQGMGGIIEEVLKLVNFEACSPVYKQSKFILGRKTTFASFTK